MEELTTKSGIVIPGDSSIARDFAAARELMRNQILARPEVREYAKGGSKHFDNEVEVLNRELAGINEQSGKQEVFAAFMPRERALNGMFGVVIWAWAREEGQSTCLGNPWSDRDGKLWRGKGDNVRPVLDWLRGSNMLLEENRSGIDKWFAKENKATADKAKSEWSDHIHNTKEAVLDEVYKNTPMNGDSPRTQWKQKSGKKGKKSGGE